MDSRLGHPGCSMGRHVGLGLRKREGFFILKRLYEIEELTISCYYIFISCVFLSSSILLETPSLWWIFFRWVSTVKTLSISVAAMSLLDLPSAISLRTSIFLFERWYFNL